LALRIGEKKKMAKKLTVALVAIMLIVGFAVGLIASPFILAQNSNSTDAVWANMQKTGVIRVGTDPTWPPYQMIDNETNKIVGFEVELADACAAKLNLTIDWQSVSFDSIILSVQNHQLDMGVSGFSITPERLDQVCFTVPHSTTVGQAVMLKSVADAKGITTLHALSDFKDAGIKVGVQSGNVEQEELQDAQVSTATWSDSASPFQDLVSANPSVQAVYAETPITTSWIAELGAQGHELVVVYSHPYYPVAFVTAQDSPTFTAKMNAALVDLIYDGTVDHLKAKWNA